MTMRVEDNKNDPEYPLGTGIFVSRLIQESYDAGNNNFRLSVENLNPLECLASEVKGSEDRQLYLTIEGNDGKDFAYQSEHAHFIVDGNTDGGEGCFGRNIDLAIYGWAGDSCGSNMRKSRMYVRDGTRNLFGCRAEGSELTSDGPVGMNVAENARNSTFVFNGGIGRLFVAENKTSGTYQSLHIHGSGGVGEYQPPRDCTITMAYQDGINEIIKNIPRDNDLFLIMPDGGETRVAGYGRRSR